MKFSTIVVVITSLGVYATDELCTDSTLKVKTEFVEASCSELVTTDNLDCTQPTIMSHCKKSCKLDFCCADSQAQFKAQSRLEIMLPDTTKPKYMSCGWKSIKRQCDMIPGLAEACPVTCGRCNISHEKVRKEAIKELEATSELNVYAYGDNLYKLSETKRIWSQHETLAVQWGGHLASVHTAAENNFILKLLTLLYPGRKSFFYLNGSPEKSFHIGLKRNVTDQFEYTDGTDFDFSNWADGEPNNHGGKENVVEISKYNGEYEWNDIKAHYKKGGIYKKRTKPYS